MAYIPQDFISKLLDHIDIVEVISNYVPLKKTGHNYMGCCPFHHEKTPSFSVVQSKSFYHCFGCGVGGSSLKFIMEIEKLSFVDAVSKLALVAGMEVPYEANSLNKSSIDKSLYKVNSLVSSYFKDCLSKSDIAKNYLHKRGVISEVFEKFQLGYSLPSWNNLEAVLNSNPEVTLNLLKQAGLWIESTNSYARFRNRIMFPIHNVQGKIIGFGGRVFTENSSNQPKYLNSPETIIFKKSNELYGLFQALKFRSNLKKSEEDFFLMVEGYMDVISVSQHGISNVVATLGTAATYQHFVKLFKYTEKIIICFDGDIAGRRAAYRAMQHALPIIRPDKVLRFCFLPEGYDPDTYIRKFGKKGFEEFLKNSESLSTFIFNNLVKELDINTPEGRAKFVSYLKSIVNKIYDEIVKEFLLEDLAKKLELDLERLKAMLSINSGSKSINSSQVKYNEENIKFDSSKLSVGNNKIIRKATSILIQFPELLGDINLNEFNITKKNIDNFVLLEVMKIINEGASTTGQILDNWVDSKSKEYVFQLASVEHLVKETELKVELHEILKSLTKVNSNFELEALLSKVKASGMRILSDDEKIKLTELLKEK